QRLEWFRIERVAPASEAIAEFAREQVLEGTSRIEPLSVARRLTDYRFLTAFFLAQRVQSFRNRLKSLARDRVTTYLGQTVSAFLDFFQGTINALEPLDVANDQVAIPLKRVESLCIVLELDSLTSAPPSYIR